MAVACLASIAIFAGGMAALYGLDWYKNRRRQNRKLAKKLVVQEGRTTTTTKEEQQPIAEQLA
jgi:hypothetical protein